MKDRRMEINLKLERKIVKMQIKGRDKQHLIASNNLKEDNLHQHYVEISEAKQNVSTHF